MVALALTDPFLFPEGNHLLRDGRLAMAASVRAEDHNAFIYEMKDGKSFESQFDAELAARVQQSSRPWTKFKAGDLRALESHIKEDLPDFTPIVVVESDGKEHDILFEGIAIEMYEMPPEAKRRCYLPWKFLCVSWTITLLFILVTCWFTVLYGLRIGRIRSIHWLSEVSLAFFQSILFTQPLRIVIVGFFMSLIFRVNLDVPL
jgi:hypothetical protein